MELPDEVIKACKTITDFICETHHVSAHITQLGTLILYGPEDEKVFTPIAQDEMLMRKNERREDECQCLCERH